MTSDYPNYPHFTRVDSRPDIGMIARVSAREGYMQQQVGKLTAAEKAAAFKAELESIRDDLLAADAADDELLALAAGVRLARAEFEFAKAEARAGAI